MTTISTLYRGSVKNVLGPLVTSGGGTAAIFEYTDAYSVFDWGRMPDTLPRKGEALALLAAEWFEKMERADTWREFSKTKEALELRKGNRFGATFNEIGEKLQSEGLRTHYLGSMPPEWQAENCLAPKPLAEINRPIRHVAVRHVTAVKPTYGTALARAIPDYSATRMSPLPRLVPLEIVFRFSCPEGSSIIERLKRDPSYLQVRGFQDTQVEAGHQWQFPVLEAFTKLETSDRPVTPIEAVAISGIAPAQFQELMLKTAWIAGLLKSVCASKGLELADGKVEWAINEKGECFLVDAIGPDELRILKNGVQLSKEFLRHYYRTTPWYQALAKAKKQAEAQGVADWKKLVPLGPPTLPPSHRDLATQLYLALANTLSSRSWFSDAWSLDQVVAEIQNFTRDENEVRG